MKKIILSLTLLVGLMASPSMAAVQLSISGTDAGAGNSLELQLGQTGSMFVWMSTDAGQTIAGVGVDLLSSDTSVLEATAYNIANPASRWLSVAAGDLGDLSRNSNAFALPPFAGTGLSTSGQGDFALFSEIQFSATALGATTLSLQANSNGFADSNATNNDLSGQLAGVTGSVNVVSAVPEPSSAALLVMAAGVAAVRRRRRS